MRNLEKYKGVFPAFYACYDDMGEVSPERTRALALHLLDKGVKGLYVCGSSGECIYQTKQERMLTLEAVMDAVGGKMPIIAHVAAASTRESIALAQHAASLGVDAVAAIPPIYFRFPDHAVEAYWREILESTDRDFIMYNIPQTTGFTLTLPLFRRMLEYPQVIGVKNSSLPTQDIEMFKAAGGEDCVVFNGPDEQFVAGRAIGADGGIGGTYAVMPELFLKADAFLRAGDLASAQAVQHSACRIIAALCSGHGGMYAVIKAVLREKGLNIGGVRGPLAEVTREDRPLILQCAAMIDEAIKTCC